MNINADLTKDRSFKHEQIFICTYAYVSSAAEGNDVGVYCLSSRKLNLIGFNEVH